MANEPANQPQPPPIEEIFDQFKGMFGEFFGNQPATNRGADLRQMLELTHVEARDGVKREIAVERAIVVGDAPAQTTERRAQAIIVSVPAGVEAGQTLRLAGRGDERIGGAPGHLYLELAIDQLGIPRRRGNDTEVEIEVTLRHVLFGGRLVVQTLDGPAPIKVPRGVRDGDRVTMSGRGASSRAPTGDGPYRGSPRGDQHVVFRVRPDTRDLARQIRICTVMLAAFAVFALVLASTR